MSDIPIKPSIILGLGNPGAKYEKTFHNAGAIAIDRILDHQEYDAPAFSSPPNKNFLFSKYKNIIFAKSNTFMNDSVLAMRDIVDFFDVNPKNILVVHDDSDLPLGEFKISCNRGAAGHRGIAPIIDLFGQENICRLRLGVRPEPSPSQSKRIKAVDLVLSRLKDEQLESLYSSIDAAWNVIENR